MAQINFQSIALGVYLFICLFDFVLVPVWYGFNRPEISGFIATMNTMEDTQLPYLQELIMLEERILMIQFYLKQ